MTWRERNEWLEKNGRQCSDCKQVRFDEGKRFCLAWSEVRGWKPKYTLEQNQAPWCQLFETVREGSGC